LHWYREKKEKEKKNDTQP